MTDTARRRGRGAPRRLHPVRSVVPFSVAGAVFVGWAVVAHDSGSGWVQVLGEAVGAAVVVGLFGPAVALARTRLECRAAPPDATAGAGVELTVAASQRVRVHGVDPPGPEAFVGPARHGGAPCTVVVVPARHGVVDSVTLDVDSAAPFGLLWWSKRVVVDLPVPVHVAPRRGAAHAARSLPDDAVGDGARRVAAVLGEARGARPYRPGDSRRWVHWPSTAHTGALMVREMEGPVRTPATVTVSLPADPDAAERVVEQALATVLVLLARDTPVTLVTTERRAPGSRPGPDSPTSRRAATGRDSPTGAAPLTVTVSAPVDDRRSAGRRLARAEHGGGGDPGGVVIEAGGRDDRLDGGGTR